MLDDPARREHIVRELQDHFGVGSFAPQSTHDSIPTLWVAPDRIQEVLAHLKTGVKPPYRTLYDLAAIDERHRCHRGNEPTSDFTAV
jgi:hypothetical protein